MVRHFGLGYIRISLFRHHYQWSPLKLPCKSRVNAPIQPGLFKGTYSAHGIEVLSLDYDEELTEVTVTKITVRYHYSSECCYPYMRFTGFLAF